MHDRDTASATFRPHHELAEAAAVAAPAGTRAGLWAYLAEVRVIAAGRFRAETRTVSGLFCAGNHHEARARATALAAEKARELGHAVDISLTRLW